MATRSTIAYRTAEGKIRAVYCHWDGYPAYNGAMLQEHYRDPAKVAALVTLGNISSLGRLIGEKHDFDWRDDDAGFTTYYGRDRGEPDQDAKEFETVADWVEHYKSSWAEYFYLFNGDHWIVTNGHTEGGFPVFDFLGEVLTKLSVDN